MTCLSGPGAGLGRLLVTLGLIGVGPAALADDPGVRAVRVVALGDSITRGVRPASAPRTRSPPWPSVT